MPLFKFRICWDEDEQIYRDIVLKSGQTFDLFQSAILKAFNFKDKKSASFFESNERWMEGREISSEVLHNKKGATVLSMMKTPVSALVNQPEKRFLFRFDPVKKWLFLITLIALEKEDDASKEYPLLVKSEGISPNGIGVHAPFKESLTETEDRFDLSKEDMEEQGFGEDNGL